MRLVRYFVEKLLDAVGRPPVRSSFLCKRL